MPASYKSSAARSRSSYQAIERSQAVERSHGKHLGRRGCQYAHVLAPVPYMLGAFQRRQGVPGKHILLILLFIFKLSNVILTYIFHAVQEHPPH